MDSLRSLLAVKDNLLERLTWNVEELDGKLQAANGSKLELQEQLNDSNVRFIASYFLLACT